MKRVIARALAGLFALTGVLAVMEDASARGRGGGGTSHSSAARSHAGGSHSSYRGARVGVAVRAPIVVAAPRWYYSPGYYPGYGPYYPQAAYYGQDPGVAYVEQSAPLPPQTAQVQPEAYWYYCTDSQTYFPYVQTCASPWQRVIPHAPQ